MEDVASRLSNRVQITSDGHRSYVEAVGEAFGADVDYAMLVKRLFLRINSSLRSKCRPSRPQRRLAEMTPRRDQSRCGALALAFSGVQTRTATATVTEPSTAVAAPAHWIGVMPTAA